jgi:hypothetical protein
VRPGEAEKSYQATWSGLLGTFGIASSPSVSVTTGASMYSAGITNRTGAARVDAYIDGRTLGWLVVASATISLMLPSLGGRRRRWKERHDADDAGSQSGSGREDKAQRQGLAAIERTDSAKHLNSGYRRAFGEYNVNKGRNAERGTWQAVLWVTFPQTLALYSVTG